MCQNQILKSLPVFHPLESPILYFSSIKVHLSGSDKKWSRPSSSSNSLACGGWIFSILSIEWDVIQSVSEKSVLEEHRTISLSSHINKSKSGCENN